MSVTTSFKYPAPFPFCLAPTPSGSTEVTYPSSYDEDLGQSFTTITVPALEGWVEMPIAHASQLYWNVKRIRATVLGAPLDTDQVSWDFLPDFDAIGLDSGGYQIVVTSWRRAVRAVIGDPVDVDILFPEKPPHQRVCGPRLQLASDFLFHPAFPEFAFVGASFDFATHATEGMVYVRLNFSGNFNQTINVEGRPVALRGVNDVEIEHVCGADRRAYEMLENRTIPDYMDYITALNSGTVDLIVGGATYSFPYYMASVDWAEVDQPAAPTVTLEFYTYAP